MKQNNLSPLSSSTISALRFPLMVGIVFIHFGILHGISIHGVTYGDNPPIWVAGVNNLISNVLARIGVPLFFLISGYLFFLNGFSKQSYVSKLKKRARTLLIPYVLWNAIFIIYSWVMRLPVLHFIFPNSRPVDWSLWKFIACFFNCREGLFANPDAVVTDFNVYPQCVPMWYVRDLMLVMVLSPIIYWLVKKLGWWVVLFLGAAWYCSWGSKTLGYPRQLIAAIFFFSIGACYAIKSIDFVASMRLNHFALWLYPFVAIADLLTKNLAYNPYIHNAGILIGLVAAVSLTACLLENKRIRVNHFLASASFFLFALHTLFMGNLGSLITKLTFVDTPVYMLLLYLVVPTLTICICLAFYWLMQRYTPRLLALLTGGR